MGVGSRALGSHPPRLTSPHPTRCRAAERRDTHIGHSGTVAALALAHSAGPAPRDVACATRPALVCECVPRPHAVPCAAQHQPAASEDVDVLAHAAALILRDALGDPYNVPDLLLLELHEGIVHAIVELLLEGEPVEVDLELEELVLDRLLLVHAHLAQQPPVLLVRVDRAAHGVEVCRLGQARGALGEEQADRGVELLALLQVEVGVERVHCDVDRATVGLQLEDATHDLGGRAAHLLAEIVKILKVGFVQRVADDLDVHLVDVFERQAIAEVRAERRVDKHHPVQIGWRRRDCERRYGVEHAERVALLEQLARLAVVVRARDYQHDIVDHIAIRDVFHECGHWLDGL
mmetsp:Transcript_7515/g.15042  ORF Transcript_7515/g.15042 Transcript_7515/m.15042 type:complete len:349 (+) Transcript_7515:111-1157(+)